jgi:hypothetical protein
MPAPFELADPTVVTRTLTLEEAASDADVSAAIKAPGA